MPDYSDLTDLHLAILGVLWERRESSIADIHAAIHARTGVSRKTVATLLSRLERRGLVRHRSVGQLSLYTAIAKRRVVLMSRVASMLGAIFEVPAGTAPPAVSERDVRPGDVERLRDLLKRAERDIRGPA